ncbi:MAG: aminopeptidase [Gammaproteobacteria bacterium]|nr:aminopeptidase [Gammaproteobacteria bacterium]
MALPGCESMSYMGQAAWGQAQLFAARQPLERLLADPSTDSALRERLRTVNGLREFARQSLGMENTRGFDSFVATGRDFVVWNVVASGEFSVTATSWCFPVAGCVNYRGYFERARAERFAAKMARRGFDTHVYGVTAYSTLGWFADPVLDTWIDRDEPALAALVFHELAHQVLYASGDTEFSESFARVVEREGVRRWLAQEGDDTAYAQYLREQQTEAQFSALLAATRERLELLYRQPLAAPLMRERKASVLEDLRTEYARASASWPAPERFDAWMRAPLNNARLASLANYQRWVGAFEQLLLEHQRDLSSFHAAARVLSELPAARREARLLVLEHAATMTSDGNFTE